MRQIAFSILIEAAGYPEIGQRVAQINRTLRMVDENGKNLLMAYTEFDAYFASVEQTEHNI